VRVFVKSFEGLAVKSQFYTNLCEWFSLNILPLHIRWGGQDLDSSLVKPFADKYGKLGRYYWSSSSVTWAKWSI